MSTKPDKVHMQKPSTVGQPPKAPPVSSPPGPKPGKTKPTTPPKK